MRLYVSQTRASDLVRHLWKLGIGECTARGELPPRRHPWFYDNGAYSDWKANSQFDDQQFLRDMESIYSAIDRPEFIVIPDIVAGGLDSLAFSARWVHKCRGLAPLYLAVQDGMVPSDLHLPWISRYVNGLFVGGTLKWKIRTAGMWVNAAERFDMPCHIGRCGTFNRVRWASRIGAHSLDSALPLWSRKTTTKRKTSNLGRFLKALEPARQPELFGRGVAA